MAVVGVVRDVGAVARRGGGKRGSPIRARAHGGLHPAAPPRVGRVRVRRSRCMHGKERQEEEREQPSGHELQENAGTGRQQDNFSII